MNSEAVATWVASNGGLKESKHLYDLLPDELRGERIHIIRVIKLLRLLSSLYHPPPTPIDDLNVKALEEVRAEYAKEIEKSRLLLLERTEERHQNETLRRDIELMQLNLKKVFKERDDARTKQKCLKVMFDEAKAKLDEVLVEAKKVAHSDLPIHVDQIMHFETVINKIEDPGYNH